MKPVSLITIALFSGVACVGEQGTDSRSLTSPQSTVQRSALTAPSAAGLLAVGSGSTADEVPDQVSLFNLPVSQLPQSMQVGIPFGAGNKVAVGDLNGDGKPEIVTVASDDLVNSTVGTAGEVRISDLNGNRLDPITDLGFSADVLPGGGIPPANDVAIGDINGDGFGDIVLGTYGEGVTVYLSHQASQAPPPFVLGSKVVNLTLDGGSLQSPFPLGSAQVPNDQTFQLGFPLGATFAVCDIDHDGFDEVLVRNDQFGVFACADLDNDGFADVIIGELTSNSANPTTTSGLFNVFSLPAQSQAGAFFSGINSDPPLVPFAAMAAGDLDGDGLAEVVIGNPGDAVSGGSIRVLSMPSVPRLPEPVVPEFSIGDALAVLPHPLVAKQAPAPVAVTLDYQLAFVLYDPPGDQSSVNYSAGTSLGTTSTDTATTTEGVSLSIKVPASSVLSFGGSASASASQSKTTTNTTTLAETSAITVKPNSAKIDTPNSGLDRFYMIFNIPGTESFTVDGQPAQVTWDFSSGTPEIVLGAWLQEIALGQPSTVTDLSLKNLLAEITPDGAAQVLALDPNFTGEDIAANPNRYAPFIPDGMSSNVIQLPHPQGTLQDGTSPGQSTVTLTGSTATGTGMGTGNGVTTSYSVSVTGGFATGTFTYSSAETWSSTTTTTTTNADSITLGTDQPCSGATVSLYRDQAFGGSFITKQSFFNDCTTLPMALMSFEVLADWQVQGGGTAALNGTAVAGAESFSVTASPQGWTPIVSIPVASSVLRGAAVSSDLSKVSFALNIPSTQPNPYWVGDAQMFISSPTAGVFNVPLGEVNLTGLPEGQFNRIGFTIPSNALPAITGDNPDVTFTIVLNVNAGTTGWLIDDLEIGG